MSETKRILVVDDLENTRELLERNLSAEGYEVVTAPGGTEAIGILETTPVDLVITDYKMPTLNGIDMIRHIRENHKDTEVMMITGYPSIANSVKAIKNGASEYLPKPFTVDELFAAVERTLNKLHLRRTGNVPPEQKSIRFPDLIGDSPAMRDIFKAIAKVASTPVTVLITGESGTGKELVARAIHYNSPRASAPFVPVNCGGIPEGLLESELFGYEKGAFTGAVETRAGFFQTADGGTIFLDEIGDTSIAMQTKLLRALQEKEVCMLGSRRSQKVNVRIIAATNKDLSVLVDRGLFREDLFYRLNVINIVVPPLRKRNNDILLLVSHFASQFSASMGCSAPAFSEKALQTLKEYNWPGNIRELENVIQRLVVMAEGHVIEVPDLPSLMRFSALRNDKPFHTLAEMESEYIRTVLASVNGNKTKAAKILAIDRKTLREKLKKQEPESD